MHEDIISYGEGVELSEALGEEVSEDEILQDVQDDYDEDSEEDHAELEKELESEDGYIPQQPNDLSTVAFVERVIHGKDKISTANLTSQEIGTPVFPIRMWRNLAAVFGGNGLYDMPVVASACLRKAHITEATSLSRDAKAIELGVTTKRVRERKASKGVTDFMEHINKKRSSGF